MQVPRWRFDENASMPLPQCSVFLCRRHAQPRRCDRPIFS